MGEGEEGLGGHFFVKSAGWRLVVGVVFFERVVLFGVFKGRRDGDDGVAFAVILLM